MKKIIIATRASPLAIAQVDIFIKELEKFGIKKEHIELLPLTTKGDSDLSTPLFHKGGKGLFIREIEQAVVDKKAHFAVHSLKDLPLKTTSRLSLAGFIGQEGLYSDILVANNNEQNKELSAIGTSSQRRASQLKIMNPRTVIAPLRGSVQKRLEQNDGQKFSSIVLAHAGVQRLGLENQLSYRRLCPWSEMTPAFCQGIIGIQAHSGHLEHIELLKAMTEDRVYQRQYYERYIAHLFEATCQSAFGVYVQVGKEQNKAVVFAYQSTSKWKREIFYFHNEDELKSELKKRFDYENIRWSHCQDLFF
jgi:hydroxymethylbilane synthase